MNIEARRVRDVLIINISGSLDSVSARDAQDRILNIVHDEDIRVLLNLENLAYLSSMGIRVILQTAKLLDEKRGKLKICKATGKTKEVLDVFAFHSLIEVYDTEHEAFSAFRGSPAGD
jgi:anti-sigma B factor antagonist